MYDSVVMCRKEVDTPWSIYRDFTVNKKNICEVPNYSFGLSIYLSVPKTFFDINYHEINFKNLFLINFFV